MILLYFRYSNLISYKKDKDWKVVIIFFKIFKKYYNNKSINNILNF